MTTKENSKTSKHYDYSLNKYYDKIDYRIFKEPTEEEIKFEIERLYKIKNNEKKSEKFYKRIKNEKQY